MTYEWKSEGHGVYTRPCAPQIIDDWAGDGQSQLAQFIGRIMAMWIDGEDEQCASCT